MYYTCTTLQEPLARLHRYGIWRSFEITMVVWVFLGAPVRYTACQARMPKHILIRICHHPNLLKKRIFLIILY